MNASRADYIKELGRIVHRPGWELRELTKLWDGAERKLRRKRERLLQCLPSDDPVRLKVDLLHSIKRVSDETLHTQALAYILDPAQKHGFGSSVLTSLLEKIAAINGRAGAARILHSTRRRTTQLIVKPEYRFRIEGFRNRSIARSDIWIETQARRKSCVLVIENKIGAAESNAQLVWYERKVQTWCRARGHNRRLLVFLTPDGRRASTSKTQKWIALSYLQLAAALRTAWIANRKAAGADWLALYIASIMHGVLGIDPDRPAGFSASDIETYLGRYG